MLELRVQLLDNNAKLPKYATDGCSGLDVYAIEDDLLLPGTRRRIRTGIAIEIPPGYEAQVRPRSGMADRYGTVPFLGTVDQDYRGEIGVQLINLGTFPYPIKRHDRIAQLVIAPVLRVRVVLADALESTVRGANGFGSTGR